MSEPAAEPARVHSRLPAAVIALGVVDASVVLTARRERAVVVTSDITDLRRLDPGLSLERI